MFATVSNGVPTTGAGNIETPGAEDDYTFSGTGGWTWDPAYQELWFLVFDNLMHQEPDGKLIPWLATEWKNLNPTTWQFKLRPNIKFHNGETFDAAAVKYSIERTLANDKAPMRANVSAIDHVDVVDALTANFVTIQDLNWPNATDVRGIR